MEAPGASSGLTWSSWLLFWQECNGWVALLPPESHKPPVSFPSTPLGAGPRYWLQRLSPSANPTLHVLVRGAFFSWFMLPFLYL